MNTVVCPKVKLITNFPEAGHIVETAFHLLRSACCSITHEESVVDLRAFFKEQATVDVSQIR